MDAVKKQAKKKIPKAVAQGMERAADILRNKLLNASDEEFDKIVAEMPEDERNLWIRQSKMLVARAHDSVRAFSCFFELMEGFPLHKEGERWVKNMYLAHKRRKGLAQECFRESGKTTVFSKNFALFRIGKEPHKTGAIIRINDPKAQETASAVANVIENNPMWKVIFPHVVPDKERGWGAQGYYVKRTDVDPQTWTQMMTEGRPLGPTFIGHGWESGSIIGSRYNNFLIVDDIHDEKNTASASQLAGVVKFYKETLIPCIMEGAWEIWNFTPWLVNDVYAYIKSTGMYVVSKSPVMRDAQEGEEGATLWEADPLIPLSGKYWKLSWPEQFGFERLTDVYRRIGQVSFAKMYMLDLEATRGINLKTEWLHQYPAAQIFPSWPVIMGIDYASTMDKLKDKERDFFSLAILRAIPGGGLVLVDGYRGHVSKGEALNVAASYSGTYPTLQKIGVENIGKGEEFYNDLMLTVDMNGKPLPLMPVKHGRKSKGDRFENWLAPRFQASRIWVSDVKTPYIQSFENQWSLWPNAPHDDDLDAVYMAAFAGEGFMPAMAERTFRSEMKQDNPFLAFAGG